jgi:hypothetical protein
VPKSDALRKVIKVSDSIPSNDSSNGASSEYDEALNRALNIQHELNSLLDERSRVLEACDEPSSDPFTDAYHKLADVILTCSQMYVGLRNLEDRIYENLGEEGDAV